MNYISIHNQRLSPDELVKAVVGPLKIAGVVYYESEGTGWRIHFRRLSVVNGCQESVARILLPKCGFVV